MSNKSVYNKINEVLNIDTEEFYSEWKTIENLSNRIKFIEDCVKDEDDLVSIAAFSFIEGAVLYSSFAFIKHFQSQECGKNLLKNICRGVDLSMVDESAHSVGGALLFRTILEEAIEHNVLSAQETALLFEKCSQMAETVYNHECAIIDMIFQDEISGINKQQMKEFVKHRLNVCLAQLGYQEIFIEEDDTVKKWFYRNTTSKKLTDFFTANGSEYNINWNEQRFGEVWN